ncbi:MAG: hypothetical protein V4498_02950 [candidate division FCPU426 bacterium]
MEFRIIANENPVGSRKWFEDRINLHLSFGWQPHGGMIATGVKAKDWSKGGLGPSRPEESLFVFQALLHSREDVLGHLKPLASEFKTLAGQADTERDATATARFKKLARYLSAEQEYHPQYFVDRENQEAGSILEVSKDRLRKNQE